MKKTFLTQVIGSRLQRQVSSCRALPMVVLDRPLLEKAWQKGLQRLAMN